MTDTQDEIRIGRFQIARRYIDDDPAEIIQVFAGLLVVRAECRFDIDCIEYTAIDVVGESFRPVPRGTFALQYMAEFESVYDGEMQRAKVRFSGWRET